MRISLPLLTGSKVWWSYEIIKTRRHSKLLDTLYNRPDILQSADRK